MIGIFPINTRSIILQGNLTIELQSFIFTIMLISIYMDILYELFLNLEVSGELFLLTPLFSISSIFS